MSGPFGVPGAYRAVRIRWTVRIPAPPAGIQEGGQGRQHMQARQAPCAGSRPAIPVVRVRILAGLWFISSFPDAVSPGAGARAAAPAHRSFCFLRRSSRFLPKPADLPDGKGRPCPRSSQVRPQPRSRARLQAREPKPPACSLLPNLLLPFSWWGTVRTEVPTPGGRCANWHFSSGGRAGFPR